MKTKHFKSLQYTSDLLSTALQASPPIRHTSEHKTKTLLKSPLTSKKLSMYWSTNTPQSLKLVCWGTLGQPPLTVLIMLRGVPFFRSHSTCRYLLHTTLVKQRYPQHSSKRYVLHTTYGHTKYPQHINEGCMLHTTSGHTKVSKMQQLKVPGAHHRWSHEGIHNTAVKGTCYNTWSHRRHHQHGCKRYFNTHSHTKVKTIQQLKVPQTPHR